MSVLDASVMIAWLDAHDAHHESAVDMLARAIYADEPLTCSPITLAEVLVAPARRGELDRARQTLESLGIEAAITPADAAYRLAGLRVATGLKMPDCCVLLAMQAHQSGAILTFDGSLAKAAERLGMTVRTS